MPRFECAITGAIVIGPTFVVDAATPEEAAHRLNEYLDSGRLNSVLIDEVRSSLSGRHPDVDLHISALDMDETDPMTPLTPLDAARE
jgi:hypothetical protein